MSELRNHLNEVEQIARTPLARLTPNERKQRSMYMAISQLHLAADIKRKRMAKYGQAHPDDASFSFDNSQIFPRDPLAANNERQNMVLGIGNQLRPSNLFRPRNQWNPGSGGFQSKLDWHSSTRQRLCLPMAVFQPGKTCDIMSIVQATMEHHYVHHEERAIARGVLEERPEEDAFDGVCTTGFSIDDIPFTQPQLEPILLDKPINILSRLPVHTSIDVNHQVKEGCPKVRVTLNVYDEEVHGYGMTRDQALNDGCMKLQFMFQHALDVHEFDCAYWHPLPPKQMHQKRNQVEMEMINIVRSKIDDGHIEIDETAPRLFTAHCTVEGLKISAQSYSKKLAKKRLCLFLMLLMPNQLEHVDPSAWLGDGAGFAPDATYGQTVSQRGAKRPSMYEQVDRAPEMKKMRCIAHILVESDDQLKNRLEKHVTAYTTMLDGTGFPINVNNKKSLHFFLSHRCQARHKYTKIDKTITDTVSVTLLLPDGTEYYGNGKTVEMAKHMAMLSAQKENQMLKQKEPMSTYGVCTYGLMQELMQDVQVHSTAAQDGTTWTCEIEALRAEGDNKSSLVRLQKSDFTKKGAQRLAAFAFMKQFNEQSKQALEWAIEIAKDKLDKHDGVDKSKLVNAIFQRIGLAKPSKDESGVYNFEVYGMKYQIKSTGDSAQDDELIATDIRQHFGFLLEKYDPCPLKVLHSKMQSNKGLKEMKHTMYQWTLEFADQKYKYYRVALILPNQDRFIGEGYNLVSAQKNAAFNCLQVHPVLRLGGVSGHQTTNFLGKFEALIEPLPAEHKFEIISGQADCPMTMYCRVRLTCHATAVKVFEATAAGVSYAHACQRAAQKIVEEPQYGSAPILEYIRTKKLEVKFINEIRKKDEIMQKCSLEYKPTANAEPQVFKAEGLNLRLAKTKAMEKLMSQTFGPDQSRKPEREVTSIKMIKPINRGGKNDPPLPPQARAIVNWRYLFEGDVPNLNEDMRKRYELGTERQRKRMAKIVAVATVKTDPDNPSHVDDDNELDQPEPEQMDYDEEFVLKTE